METGVAKLYVVRISAPCRAVWLFCVHHQVPVDVIDIDLLGDAVGDDATEGEKQKRTEQFLAKNPNHTVPVYEEADGFTLWEVRKAVDVLFVVVIVRSSWLCLGATTTDQQARLLCRRTPS